MRNVLRFMALSALLYPGYAIASDPRGLIATLYVLGVAAPFSLLNFVLLMIGNDREWYREERRAKKHAIISVAVLTPALLLVLFDSQSVGASILGAIVILVLMAFFALTPLNLHKQQR